MAFEIELRKRRGNALIETRIATPGGLTVLFGPSGAGKTSVLDMVAGLLRPDAGYVRVDGRTLFDSAKDIDVPPEQRHAGYVFQDTRLFPHRRVRDNLLYGHRLAAPKDRRLGLAETVSFLGIEELLDRSPRTLSGGEARRVAIGRALLSGARFLLLDEPMSFVDRARREEITRLIERIRDELGLPMLYVTHDQDEARRLATAIVQI